MYNTNYMRANKLFKRPKAENGAGRSVKIKHLLLPEEVVEDLKLYKSCYERCFSTKKDKNGNPDPIRVTFEQMLRRWMDNIGRIDPDVAKMFSHFKESREKEQRRLASRLGISVDQLKENVAAYDPADPENEPWKLRYFFEKDGIEINALPGVHTPFLARINGDYVEMKDMIADGWTLKNEDGDELDFAQAVKICALINKNLQK